MKKWQYTLFLALVVVSAAIAKLVAERVTEPFIDEFFHLRQCQKYCHYDFFSWDNKITTPPGLYLLAFAYAKTVEWTAGVVGMDITPCNYTLLRSFNLVGGLVAIPLIARKLKGSFCAANLASVPLLYTYYFLFYTDVWSTVLVLIALVFAETLPFGATGSAYAAGIVGFLSLWLRQTNIVWVGFVLVALVERRREVQNSPNSAIRKRSDGQSIAVFVNEVVSFAFQLLKDWTIVVPFALNAVIFVVFIKVNGGITFGDKENHQLNLHLVQVFYCLAFIAIITWPVWLLPQRIRSYIRFTITSNYGANAAMTALSFLVIHYIIDNFTVVHPFLLADNRHYTFYIYRRILSHRYSQLITVPFYHFSIWVVASTLQKNNRPLALSSVSIITFFAAIVITVIPLPLFEPRYYIMPLVIFRLYVQPENEPFSRQWRHAVEFIWNMAVNVATFAVFFGYEFKWESEGNAIQRIIW